MNATATLRITGNHLTEALSSALVQKPSAFDVFVSARRYGKDVSRPIKVLFRSEAYFWVNERELAALRAGSLPEDLGLEPTTDGHPDDFYPADDRACSAADRAIREAKEAI